MFGPSTTYVQGFPPKPRYKVATLLQSSTLHTPLNIVAAKNEKN